MLFAQVWEDVNVEIGAIKEIITGDKLRVSCVTSGGCSLLSLLSDKIEQIDCIDINPMQNYLAELKLAACTYFQSSADAIKCLQGELSKGEVDNVLSKLELSREARDYWESNVNIVYQGVNKNGKLEELFHELVLSNFDYERVFNRGNLIKTFGEGAVENSKLKEFHNHFKNVVETYKKLYQPDGNYFYHRILFNSYSEDCAPPYFYNLEAIKRNCTKVNFITSDYPSHIKSTPEEYYDMIQTSNLTDWMQADKLDGFLKSIYRSLKKNGCAVMRRLNGDYGLEEHMSKYFTCHTVHDKSHFYTEVVVGIKI
jgi:S-adenosylmethionine:diacylglycerol 3-amino-3-carboxypropyl transferase